VELGHQRGSRFGGLSWTHISAGLRLQLRALLFVSVWPSLMLVMMGLKALVSLVSLMIGGLILVMRVLDSGLGLLGRVRRGLGQFLER
jgi:hypothetical protein